MNKKTYLGLILAACMSVISAPLWAEVTPAPEHPANITAPATTPTEHQQASELHKQHAEHHKAMAAHHEALAKEHEKAAATHEKMAK
jgi:hypothetical protein